MVRFHWHVEAGHSAWVAAKGLVTDEAAGIRHITIDAEVRRALCNGDKLQAIREHPTEPHPHHRLPCLQLAGQNETVMSLLTVPSDYLDSTKVSPVGILLAHGSEGDEWRGPLLEALAAQLAARGHLVMRYFW